MLFNSVEYALFLISVFLGYWLLARFRLLPTLFLLGASYYFYASWNPSYLALIFASSTVDYTVGRILGRVEGQGRRKALLLGSLFFNLGILCTFKYFNFFAESIALTAAGLGHEVTPPRLDVLLPVGISFYTFQSLSYTVDVYRRRLEPERSFLRYLLFVALFPQLVAGPIVRASQLLPQLGRAPELTAAQGSRGILLILIGLFKKIAIADFLAVNLVDRVFDFPERFSSIETLAAIYGYALQIYCDFSGYSDIAIGSALLLGLTLPLNFDAPYRAANLRDFWRRWHISLSRWLRDYLYIPLGGSRGTAWATTMSLMVTMVLGGLWHGAAWTFVLWGALHGVALVLTRLWERVRPYEPGNASLFMGQVLTFHFVCLCWVIFRAPSMGEAQAVVQQLWCGHYGTANLPPKVLVALAVGFLSHWLPRSFAAGMFLSFSYLSPFLQAAIALLLVKLLHHLASSEVVPFIYFQF